MNEAFNKIKETKIRRYEAMNQYARKGGTVLLGSSLMEHFMISEFLMGEGICKVVYNRAVEGWRSEELLKNLETCVFGLEPSKIFINIGSNDLDRPGDPLPGLVKNYRKILNKIKERLPDCTIYIMAYYPVPRLSDKTDTPVKRLRTRESVEGANGALKALAAETGCIYLDLNPVLRDGEGYLREEFAADDVHLKPAAYKALFDELKEYL